MEFHPFTDFTIPLPSTTMDLECIDLAHFSDTVKGQIIFHSHPFYEFIIVTTGEITISIEGNQFSLSAGCMAAIPHEASHSTTIISQDGLYNRSILHIDPAYLQNILEKSNLSAADFLFLEKPFVLNQQAVNTWAIEALFERIHFALSLEEPFRANLLSALATEFLILLYHIMSSQKAVMTPTTNKTVTRIIRYINANFANPNLSIDEISEYVYLSRGHMSRIFKSFTGISIYAYIIRLRLEYARLRIFGGVGVMDACMASGFSEYTSFLKSFKKAYGITPTEFMAAVQNRTHHKLPDT